MTKPITLAVLLTATLTVCATAQTVPTVPNGPFPEEGVFCQPFKLCAGHVTRGVSG